MFLTNAITRHSIEIMVIIDVSVKSPVISKVFIELSSPTNRAMLSAMEMVIFSSLVI